MRTVYVDNNATTEVDPEVNDALQPYLTEQYFNPSSMYEQARFPDNAVRDARATIAKALGGVAPDQFLFTSCATESNNASIFGTLAAARGRHHIITTAVEHPSVLEVCREAERRGAEVTYLPVDRAGRLDVRDFVRALRSDTLLVTIMHANNESGVIFPVEDLARITKETEPAILFHTDATQAIGKLPVDLRHTRDIDLLSFSGHKIHAPKGIGALFIRRGTPIRPLFFGGHQEGGRRGGTENVPFIVALAKACELAEHHRPDYEKVRAWRDKLEAGILERIPSVEINGHKAPRLPNTLNIACHGIEGESILYELNSQGVCASSGSACTSGSLDPSHVLKAMQVPFSALHGSVRFSLSRFNTEQDIDHILEVFPQIVRNLRRMSPYWDDVADRPKLDPSAPSAPSAP